MEGDKEAYSKKDEDGIFQSTPSAWRETLQGICYWMVIIYFNPLPPHGGRHQFSCILHSNCRFQSTPSAWRETQQLYLLYQYTSISIHSLRMEGDIVSELIFLLLEEFQSTPSAWRETAKLHRKAFFISPILVQSCKKGCKRLHSAPEKMVFFEKREKNLVRNLQHLSVRL